MEADRSSGAAAAAFGLYLGSYTGVLLAATAVPVSNRSRLFLPPIFEAAVGSGLALRLARRRGGWWSHHAASALYLGGGAAFRFAWVAAGQTSANDDETVARTARGEL